MNKNSSAILVCAILLGASMVLASNFVVPKTKKPSAAALKERYAESIADVLRSSPTTLMGIAQVQEIALEMITQVLEGELFNVATKDSLQEDMLLFEQFVERQEQINELLQQQVDFLTTQKKKYRSKKT